MKAETCLTIICVFWNLYGSPNLNEQRKWMDELHCLKLELDGTDSLEGNANRIVEMWNGL